MCLLQIAATADIHAPLYLDMFRDRLENLLKKKYSFSLFIIAGDLIERGDLTQLDKINKIIEKINVPIIACFGNNEYEEQEEEIRRKCPSIRFLSDQMEILRINEIKLGIIGSRGCLDQPTFWQRKNIPGIMTTYRNRMKKLYDLAKRLQADLKLLVIHYPPSYKVLEGENPKYFSQMGSNKLEGLVSYFDLVITAHAHNGRKLVFLNGVPVYNVALPLNEDILVVKMEKRRKGLEAFF